MFPGTLEAYFPKVIDRRVIKAGGITVLTNTFENADICIDLDPASDEKKRVSRFFLHKFGGRQTIIEAKFYRESDESDLFDRVAQSLEEMLELV